MIVDSSALLAIIFGEPEASVFEAAILRAPRPRMSTASYVEIGLRTDKLAKRVDPEVDAFIASFNIELVAVGADHALIAREASVRYGGPPARLNFGDCLTYALAKTTGEPLLFKGNDFGHTDLKLVQSSEEAQ